MKQAILDSHILIWGIKEQSEDGQEEMIERTQQFLEECRKNKTQLLVPSVVVGELLTAVDVKYHAMTLNLLQGAFLIPSYDAASSAIFARLWREKKESGAVDQIRDELQATRQELKADCMIVATALAHKADAIFSHDAKLKAFANGQIKVLEVPKLQTQHKLNFEET